MQFTPEITPVHDRDGHVCFTPEDAQKLASMLAQDPAQPYSFASSCGYRTELMVGRLLAAELPAGAIARIYQSVPEGSDALLSATPDGRDRGSFHRLLDLPAGTKEGTFPIPGTDVQVRLYGEGHAMLEDKAKSKGWDTKDGKGFRMSADNLPWQGGNHITAAIYVLDPATNKAVLTVIDPHISPDNPLVTPKEWKTACNCEDSVVIAGRIGEMAHIVTETLSEKQRAQYDDAVTKAGGSRFAPLTRQQETAVVQEMYNFEKPRQAEQMRNFSGVIEWKFPGNGLADYAERQKSDSARTDNRITTDWDSLEPDARAGLVERWISELSPLRALQNVWEQKFPPDSPSPPRHNDRRSPVASPSQVKH